MGWSLSLATAARAQDYDLLIRNGRLVDGSGGPWLRADLAVRADTIVAVGRGLPGGARRVVDASGLVVAPGFVDLHVHAWPAILERPAAENLTRPSARASSRWRGTRSATSAAAATPAAS
jgi:N-acyl-D-aspartate/D-glutamate deacylase